MKVWTLLLISIGVAMDAAAVAASLAVAHRQLRDVYRASMTFGAFQLGMASAGWLAGAQAIEMIGAWDHWIVFVLLGFIGGKMIYEAVREQEHEAAARTLTMTALLLLGVATSIDSLAVGVTLPLLELPLPLSVGLIGLTTFLISLFAGLAARRLGDAFGSKLEILGGIVLIGLGAKILIEQTS